MLRITHIITGLNVGGAERALFSLLTGGLQKQYFNNVISLLDEGHFGPLLRDAGVPVTCLNMNMRVPTPAMYSSLRVKLREAAPDIVQGWMYHGNLAASLGSPRGAKISWNIRASRDGEEGLPFATRAIIHLQGLLSGRPSSIVYNSARSKQQHEATGFAAGKATVIPNGFDTTLWRPDESNRQSMRVALALPEQAFVLGFVGRNDRDKDIPNLLSALKSVMVRFPELYLVLMGRDIAMNSTNLASAFANLPFERIRILGQRKDVAAVMNAFDVLCLSSLSEGFPNVIGEAMACGIPCISTDVGDAAEIVGETGWVVPRQDSSALASTIAHVAHLPCAERQARGVAARFRIQDKYSLDAAVRRYEMLYSSILGKS